MVNCAVEGGRYPAMQKLVLAGAQEFGGADELIFGEYPEGCPSHTERMYMFKMYAIGAAFQRGFRKVIWIDCRCRPVKPFQPIWNIVAEDGTYCSQQGDAKLGQWCSDAALAIFGIDRATAHRIPLLKGGVFGFSLDSVMGRTLWGEYQRLCMEGALEGPHYNLPGQPMSRYGDKWQGHVSNDPGVGGHRHDEAVLSFLFWKFGLPPSQDWTNIDVPEVSLIARNH